MVVGNARLATEAWHVTWRRRIGLPSTLVSKMHKLIDSTLDVSMRVREALQETDTQQLFTIKTLGLKEVQATLGRTPATRPTQTKVVVWESVNEFTSMAQRPPKM